MPGARDGRDSRTPPALRTRAGPRGPALLTQLTPRAQNGGAVVVGGGGDRGGGGGGDGSRECGAGPGSGAMRLARRGAV